VETGDGVVVMINANDNSPIQSRIADYVARLWGFASATAKPAPAATVAVRLDPKRLAAYAGYYEASENNMVALAPNPNGSGMQILVDGRPAEDLLAMDSVRFGSSDRPFRIAFTTDARGAVTVTWAAGEPRERTVPRVAPLPSEVQSRPDPDPALAARISTALAAMRDGGAALAGAADVTPGAKADFSRGPNSALNDFAGATYLGEEDVTGRGIRRHGGEVARVRLYRMPTANGARYLMVHVTSTGMVTDYDVLLR